VGKKRKVRLTPDGETRSLRERSDKTLVAMDVRKCVVDIWVLCLTTHPEIGLSCDRPYSEYQQELYDTFRKLMSLARECAFSNSKYGMIILLIDLLNMFIFKA